MRGLRGFGAYQLGLMGSATWVWVGFVIPYGFSLKLDAFLWPFKIHKTAVHNKDVGGFFTKTNWWTCAGGIGTKIW